METKSTNTKNKVTFQSETANNRRFTRVFESKLFPHFTLFSSEVQAEPTVSSFLTTYSNQLFKITNMIENNLFSYNFIVNKDGNQVPIKNSDYKNPPDHVLSAIESHGIEHGIAYQAFRMIYTYKSDTVGGFYDEDGFSSQERVKITRNFFNINGFKPEFINPLARLHYKYSVFLEKENVKTAIYAKPEETPKQYSVTINVPTPAIVSEIFVSRVDDTNTIIFNIPDIFNNSEQYLKLPVSFDSKDDYDVVIDSFTKSQNLFLSIFRLNSDGTISLKFEGLGVLNNFFLNRRAAAVEHGGNSSSDFYKLKLEEISISTDTKEEYSNRKSLLLTKKREIIERNMKDGVDEDDFILKISRSKQVMHGIKNNRGGQ
jgi:hypothetical protein